MVLSLFANRNMQMQLSFFVRAGHHGDPTAVIHGKLKTYSTDIGYAVNRIDDETFLVLAPEGPIRVRRVDAK